MVRWLAVGVLLASVGIAGHRLYQVATAPVLETVEGGTVGYGERWVRYGENNMIFVGMKFDSRTGEWIIVNYFTQPVPVDNRLGGSAW